MKGVFKKSLFALYLLTATFILLEVGLRLWERHEVNIYDPIYMPFDKSEDIAYVVKPNIKNARGKFLSVITTDSLGLRSKIAGLQYDPKKKGEFRIAIAGDSVTYGSGVKMAKDTFTQLLEDNLNQNQKALRVKVFNFSYPGYSVKEMAAALQHRMLDIEPDLVIMAIIPDDLNVARTPKVDKWGYFYQKKNSGFLSKDSFLKLVLRKIRLVYYLLDIRNNFRTNKHVHKSTTKDKLPESYKHIVRFKDLAEDSNLPYSIILLPDASSFGMIAKQLTQDKIPFLNLSSLYNEFSREHYKASKYDNHPSAIVHKRIGEKLTEYIFQKLFPKGNQKPYRIKAVENVKR